MSSSFLLDEFNLTLLRGHSPKQAFNVLTSIIKNWELYSPSVYWDQMPKRYTILNDPNQPIDLIDAQDIIEGYDYNLRNNYCGCLILNNSNYLFFMGKHYADDQTTT